MRKALNDNPMVQMAVLAVVAIAFAFILFTTILKKEDAAPATTPADPAAAVPVTSTPTDSAAVPPADSAATPTDSAATVTPSPDPAAAGAGAATDAVLPSKGLPKDVLVAFAKNKTIALLVVDPKGTSDKQMEVYTRKLKSRPDVEVFVADVKDIAEYSRITAGVSVSRVPALVVIRPRKLTNSVPTATVSYGYRGPRSVNQAIDDALYKGKQVPAFP
jgi:hypothetical protein